MLPSLAHLSLDPGEAPTGAKWYKNTKGVELTSDISDQSRVKLYAERLGKRTKKTFVSTLGGNDWVYAGAHFEKPRPLVEATTLKALFEKNSGERNSKMDKVRFYTTAKNKWLYVKTSYKHTPSDHYWEVLKTSWFDEDAWELIVDYKNDQFTRQKIKDTYKNEHEAHKVVPMLIKILDAFWEYKDSLSDNPTDAEDFFKKMTLPLDRRIE